MDPTSWSGTPRVESNARNGNVSSCEGSARGTDERYQIIGRQGGAPGRVG